MTDLWPTTVHLYFPQPRQEDVNSCVDGHITASAAGGWLNSDLSLSLSLSLSARILHLLLSSLAIFMLTALLIP